MKNKEKNPVYFVFAVVALLGITAMDIIALTSLYEFNFYTAFALGFMNCFFILTILILNKEL